MQTFWYLLLAVAGLPWLAAAAPDAAVIAHEWGTFTCLQDDAGTALGGINVDDEPVPPFVYWAGGVQVAAQYSRELRNFGLPPYSNGKGRVPGDPSVTMRLETPVVYLYPPAGQPAASVPPLAVSVEFHGGCLSQYYPYAHQEMATPFGEPLTEQTASSLRWQGVRLGSTAAPGATDDKVWTMPRETSAPVLQVTTGGGQAETVQAEHFLFYRGVGHFESPLKASGGTGSQDLTLATAEGTVAHAWLVEINAGGDAAFASLPAFGAAGAKMRAGFPAGDFSADHLEQLKASMRAALVQAGLYPDEAAAMLKTWELSYFKSAGRRLFYLVPGAWVERVLPLSVTGAPARITRVMVGRIELITDPQRAALARLSAGPCPDLAAAKQAATAALEGKWTSILHWFPPANADAFYRGEKPLTELGIPLDPLVRDYLALGRFRDALVLHAQATHPTPALAQFIKSNGIGPDQPPVLTAR